MKCAVEGEVWNCLWSDEKQEKKTFSESVVSEKENE